MRLFAGPSRLTPARTCWRRFWPDLAIIASAQAVFGQVAGFGFINFDDTQFVTENPVVRSGLSAASLRWAATAIVGGNWIPVTLLSHLLDVRLFGLWAGGHHLVNLLLHVGNALWLRRLAAGITGNRPASLLAALLFALHPLNVEPLAWVAQRRTLLMMSLGLLSVQAWVWYLRRPAPGRYLLALTLFASGLLAKPLLVTLPALLLLLDAWPFGRGLSRSGTLNGTIARPAVLVLEKVPFLALAAAAGAVALRTQAGAMTMLPPLPTGQRIEHSVVFVAWCFGKVFWPARLAVFYPYPMMGDPRLLVFVAAATLLIPTVVALRLRRRFPGFAVGWVWFLIAALPVSGILQVGEQAFADRYAYLPLTGLLPALAGALLSTTPRRPVAASAILAVVLTFSALSFAQTRHWRDGRMLFTHALEVTAGNHVAFNNLGSLAFAAGDLEGAARHFSEATRYAPRRWRPRRNLGLVRLAQGDLSGAAGEFRAAVRESPADARAHRDLGRALEKLDRPLLAREVYREALHCNPGDVVTRKMLERLEAATSRSQHPLQP